MYHRVPQLLAAMLLALLLLPWPTTASELAIRPAGPLPTVAPRLLHANRSTSVTVSFNLEGMPGYISYDASEYTQRQRAEEISRQWNAAMVTAWLTDADTREVVKLGELLPTQRDLPFVRQASFPLLRTTPEFFGIKVLLEVPGITTTPIKSAVTFLEVVPESEPLAAEKNPTALIFDPVIENNGLVERSVVYRRDAIWIAFDDTVLPHLPTREVHLRAILAFVDGSIVGRRNDLAYEVHIPPTKNLSALDTKITAIKNRFPFLRVERVEEASNSVAPPPLPVTAKEKFGCFGGRSWGSLWIFGVGIITLLLVLFGWKSARRLSGNRTRFVIRTGLVLGTITLVVIFFVIPLANIIIGCFAPQLPL